MKQLTLILSNELGLHARPASVFVKKANTFEANIRLSDLTTGGQEADGKSILNVLSLGAEHGHKIQITIEGADELAASQALEQLIQAGLNGDDNLGSV